MIFIIELLKWVFQELKNFKKIQKNQIIYYKQDHKKTTTFKRRTPAMSEIFIDDFKNYNAKYFYNLIKDCKNHIKNVLLDVKIIAFYIYKKKVQKKLKN